MPEAFSSIADMRVVIDSSTDKLEGGLIVAKNLVSRFASESNENLSLFDRVVGKSAGTVEGLAGALAGSLGKLNQYKMWYDAIVGSISAAGELVAVQTGTEDEFADLQKAASELQDTLIAGLGFAFIDVKNKAVEAGYGLLGFDANVQSSNVSAHDAASGGFTRLRQALDDVRRGFEKTVVSEKNWSLDTLENSIESAKGKLDELQAVLTTSAEWKGVSQSSLDLLKQEISGLQTQIFVLNQMAGGERILAAAKADRAVESSKGIEGLRAETEAMELNVETMRMSTAERQIYLALRKAENALDEDESLDEDAKQRALDKFQDRMQDAADATERFNNAKKHDEDAKQYLDRLNQETDALRDRVAVLGMATAAAAAYTQQARNQRAIAALGDLDPETMAKVNAQLAEQQSLNKKLADAEDQRKRQQQSEREGNSFEQIVTGLQRQTAQIVARTAAMHDGSEAGRVQALVEQQLVNLEARHIELTPQRIAAIRAQAEAQVEASMAMEETQRRLKLIGDVGNAVTSNIDSAFRRWTNGSKISVKEMAASILADLAEIQFKAAVLNPLANFLTGSQSGGGGLLGSLFGIGSSSMPSSASWAAGTSVIPAFADGGDFGPGPMMVGERGPELIWPTFPGKVIPNNALPPASTASGPPVINMPVTINAQGAYPESIADIKAALAETQAAIPQTAVAAWQEAKDRGVV